MSIRPDFGTNTGAIDEWIVARNRSVGIDAHYLTEERGEVLRLLAVAHALALRDEHRSVATKNDARSEMSASADLRLLLINHLHASEAFVAQLRARHGSARRAAIARLGI